MTHSFVFIRTQSGCAASNKMAPFSPAICVDLLLITRGRTCVGEKLRTATTCFDERRCQQAPIAAALIYLANTLSSSLAQSFLPSLYSDSPFPLSISASLLTLSPLCLICVSRLFFYTAVFLYRLSRPLLYPFFKLLSISFHLFLRLIKLLLQPVFSTPFSLKKNNHKKKPNHGTANRVRESKAVSTCTLDIPIDVLHMKNEIPTLKSPALVTLFSALPLFFQVMLLHTRPYLCNCLLDQ